MKKILVPKLRFPEFQDMGAWEEKKLNEVCEVNPAAKRLPDSFIYIDLESVEAGTLLKKNLIQLEVAPSRAQRSLKYGDVIFQMVRPYQKNNFFFRLEDEFKYVASTGYAQLRAHQSNAYLYQYIHTDRFVDRVLAKCTGSNYPAINSSDLAKIRLELPHVKEQQKIADCLSSIDDLITAKTKKIEALKTHKKGLMQQLFPREGETIPRLRFPEFRDSGEWTIGVFDDAVKIVDGDRGANYPKTYDFSSSGFCVFLNAKNVTKNGFSFDEVQFVSEEKDNALKKGKLKRSDVILTTRGSVGHFAIFSKNVPYDHMRINSGMAILRASPNLISSQYLYSFCKSEIMSSTIDNVAFGNAQQQLTVAGIKKLPLYYPGPEEQKKIAGCLSSVDNLIAAQTKKLEALKTYKKGLMQQLFPNAETERK